MTAGPVAPGAGPPRYQPASAPSAGGTSLPERSRSRAVRVVSTPAAGTWSRTGAAADTTAAGAAVTGGPESARDATARDATARAAGAAARTAAATTARIRPRRDTAATAVAAARPRS